MKTVRILAVVLLSLGLALPAGAAEQSAKEKNVRKLLKLTGATELGKQMMDAMTAQFSKMPNLPPGFIAKFQEMAHPEELIESIVPVYMKNLDDATVEKAVVFWTSPEGKKLAAAQPVMLQESMLIGQKWGQELAMKVIKELNAEKGAAPGEQPATTQPAPAPAPAK